MDHEHYIRTFQNTDRIVRRCMDNPILHFSLPPKAKPALGLNHNFQNRLQVIQAEHMEVINGLSREYAPVFTVYIDSFR